MEFAARYARVVHAVGRAGRLILWSAVVAIGLRAPAARADAFRILADDCEALQARVDLIRQAQYELDVAYYSADSGRISILVLSQLCDAARRGVCVRLLIDGLANRIPSSVEAYLVAEGVQVRKYNPVTLARLGQLNRRMHYKLLIVDGGQMIVGSRNLEDHHFGLDGINYVECDAYVSGRAAACAHEYFACLWQSDDAKPARFSGPQLMPNNRPKSSDTNPLAKALQIAKPEYVEELIDASAEPLIEQGIVGLMSGSDWSAGQPENVYVRFLHDQHPGKCGGGSIADDMLDLIDSAQQSLVIETPYPVFGLRMRRSILSARSRGVTVRILTNSLASTDQVITYAAHENLKSRLLDAGVELWEYVGPDHLHAKSLVVDGCIAVVGSYNFDVRSDWQDLEIMAAAYDVAAATALTEAVEQHMAEANLIGPDGRPSGSRSRHPNAGATKTIELWLDRAAVPLFRRLL
jgi:cardiolipin synthase C